MMIAAYLVSTGHYREETRRHFFTTIDMYVLDTTKNRNTKQDTSIDPVSDI